MIFEYIFIFVHIVLSIGASTVMIILSTDHAKTLDNADVVSAGIIILEIMFVSIKYFDAFDTNLTIAEKKKFTLTSFLFWTIFLFTCLPSSFANSKSYIELKKEKLVGQSSNLTVTDYKSRINEATTELNKIQGKLKKYEGRTEPLTDSELSDIESLKREEKKYKKRKEDAQDKEEKQDEALNVRGTEEATKKLEREKNEIDFTFGTLNIAWLFLFPFIIQGTSAWFITRGAKRLKALNDFKKELKKQELELAKKLEIKKNREENRKKKLLEQKESIALTQDEIDMLLMQKHKDLTSDEIDSLRFMQNKNPDIFKHIENKIIEELKTTEPKIENVDLKSLVQKPNEEVVTEFFEELQKEEELNPPIKIEPEVTVPEQKIEIPYWQQLEMNNLSMDVSSDKPDALLTQPVKEPKIEMAQPKRPKERHIPFEDLINEDSYSMDARKPGFKK